MSFRQGNLSLLLGINEIWNKRLEAIWKEDSSFKKECVFDEKSEIWKINFDKEMNSKTK